MLCRFFTTREPESLQSFALLIHLERDAATRPSLSSWPHQPTPSGQMVDVGFFTLYIAVVGPMLGVLPSFTVGTGATFASERRLDDWPLGQLQELDRLGRTLHEMWKSCKSMVGHPVFVWWICASRVSYRVTSIISMGWWQPQNIAIPKRRPSWWRTKTTSGRALGTKIFQFWKNTLPVAHRLVSQRVIYNLQALQSQLGWLPGSDSTRLAHGAPLRISDVLPRTTVSRGSWKHNDRLLTTFSLGLKG